MTAHVAHDSGWQVVEGVTRRHLVYVESVHVHDVTVTIARAGRGAAIRITDSIRDSTHHVEFDHRWSDVEEAQRWFDDSWPATIAAAPDPAEGA